MRDDILADAVLDIARRATPATLDADHARVMAVRKRLGQLHGGRKARD